MIHRLACAAALSLGLFATLDMARAGETLLAAVPLDRLKSAYLACDRVTSQAVVDLDRFVQCERVGDELLRRGFGGDFERLLAWWHAEKANQAAAQASVAAQR
ncbi:MAG: hypothetical protein ACXWCU_11435 [Caldimonas sp.]